MEIAKADGVHREAGWKFDIGDGWFTAASQARRLAGTDRQHSGLGRLTRRERAGQPPQVEIGRHLIRPSRETFLGRSVIRDSLNIRVAARSTSRPITYQRPLNEVKPHGSRCAGCRRDR